MKNKTLIAAILLAGDRACSDGGNISPEGTLETAHKLCEVCGEDPEAIIQFSLFDIQHPVNAYTREG